jgi:hypothetical protein
MYELTISYRITTANGGNFANRTTIYSGLSKSQLAMFEEIILETDQKLVKKAKEEAIASG